MNQVVQRLLLVKSNKDCIVSPITISPLLYQNIFAFNWTHGHPERKLHFSASHGPSWGHMTKYWSGGC